MSNHKPATALPWNLSEWGNVIPIRSRDSVVISGFALSCGPHDRDAEKNTVYIAHACNAYPELVEALRDARLQLALCVSALSGQDLTRPEIVTKEATPALHTASALLAKLGEA